MDTAKQTTITNFFGSRKRPRAGGKTDPAILKKVQNLTSSVHAEIEKLQNAKRARCDLVSTTSLTSPTKLVGITKNKTPAFVKFKHLTTATGSAVAKKLTFDDESSPSTSQDSTITPRPKTTSNNTTPRKNSECSDAPSLTSPAKSFYSRTPDTPPRPIAEVTAIRAEHARTVRARLSAIKDDIAKSQKALKELHAKRTTAAPAVAQCETPAYIRFKHLVTDEELPLPDQYAKLVEDFKSCETITSMLFNRKEMCTLDKLCSGVKQMTKRHFARSNLAQIVYLYPEAYTITVEQINRAIMSPKHELVIVPTDGVANQLSINANVMLKRRKYFWAKVFAYVTAHHSEFLQSLDPPLELPDDLIKRWHPLFLKKLNTLPPIPEAKLPGLPTNVSCITAQEMLNKVRGKLSEKIEKALERLSPSKTKVDLVPKITPETTTPAHKGIPVALLERIRRREALQLAEEMTRSSSDAKERAMLQALPRIINVVRNVFLTQQKAAIEDTALISKVQDSLGSSMSSSEVADHLKMLETMMPDFYKVLNIKSGTFVKIDKNREVKELISRVEKKLNKNVSPSV